MNGSEHSLDSVAQGFADKKQQRRGWGSPLDHCRQQFAELVERTAGDKVSVQGWNGFEARIDDRRPVIRLNQTQSLLQKDRLLLRSFNQCGPQIVSGNETWNDRQAGTRAYVSNARAHREVF